MVNIDFPASGDECIEVCKEDLTLQQHELNRNQEEDYDSDNLYETIPTVTPEFIVQQKVVNRRFVQYMLGLPAGSEINPQPENADLEENNDNDPRLLRLLRKSIEILQENCSNPWVPFEYWNTIFDSFRWFFKQLSPSDFFDIGFEQYRGIKTILKECLGKKRSFELSGTICGKTAQVYIYFTALLCTTAISRKEFKSLYNLEGSYHKHYKWRSNQLFNQIHTKSQFISLGKV